MEKLFFSRLIAIVMLCPLIAVGQEYAVFKVEGKPLLMNAAGSQNVSKGMVVKSGTISLASEDTVLLLGESGDLFQLNTSGDIAFSEFKNFQNNKNEEGFSKKYFTYVWRQMSTKEKGKTHTGNVYRDGLIDIMKFPADSVAVYSNAITFSWKAKEEATHYYFFIKDNEDNSITKLKVQGDDLTLHAGANFLKKGKEYSWGVAENEYPDFTRIKMNTLYFLDEEGFNEKKNEMSRLTEELKNLGFSEAEVAHQLCEFYKFCN